MYRVKSKKVLLYLGNIYLYVYFKNNNLEDLKQTVERLVKDDMGAIYNNQKKHIDKYSLNKVMPSWISLYTQI